MPSNKQKPVVILGAGLAGLTAANFLRTNNVPVILYEAGNKIAGLAQSFHDTDGFTYDFGAHFITNRLAKNIGIAEKCRTIRHYAETVWLGGKSYSHPFGLMRVPRMTMSGISTKLKSFGSNQKSDSAAEWFRANYGTALANEVAIPLTEAWSGAKAEDLAPAVGDGISSGIGQTLWLKFAARLTRRAVSCGYSRELPEKASVYHVYPEGGIGTLCHKLAEELTDVIKLESPVEKILVENGCAVGVRVNGQIQEASAVISTVPVNILGKIIEGSDKLEYLSRFRYRPMIFVNLRLNGRGLLPDVVTWTPESKFPFFRLTETPLSMPWLAPEGKTIITVDIGCEKNDEYWLMDDEALGEFCIEQLKTIIPNARDIYLGCRVMRTPIAYPVYLDEYEEDRLKFAKGTGIENLYSIGRNGEFSHIFMEDVYERTRKKMQQLIVSEKENVPNAVKPVFSTKEQIIALVGSSLKVKKNSFGLEGIFALKDSREKAMLLQSTATFLGFSLVIFILWLTCAMLVYLIQYPEISAVYRSFGSTALATAFTAFVLHRLSKMNYTFHLKIVHYQCSTSQNGER